MIISVYLVKGSRFQTKLTAGELQLRIPLQLNEVESCGIVVLPCTIAASASAIKQAPEVGDGLPSLRCGKLEPRPIFVNYSTLDNVGIDSRET